MLKLIRPIMASAAFWFISPVFCQQTFVGRYDVYAGFAYLDSPHIHLAERGLHLQAGTRLNTWCSFGFDYSYATGHTSLTPDLLPSALQQQLGANFAQLAAAGLLPPGYTLRVPIDSVTQNFAVGPQVSYRKWAAVTPFIRPSFGAIHETATPHSSDPITAMVVKSLAPAGIKRDWTGFYGFGGGADLNVSKHFSVRVQADFVHDHLFNDLLKDGRNTVRLSIGPGFQFGRNILDKK